jgi:hypothetical protein
MVHVGTGKERKGRKRIGYKRKEKEKKKKKKLVVISSLVCLAVVKDHDHILQRKSGVIGVLNMNPSIWYR